MNDFLPMEGETPMPKAMVKVPVVANPAAPVIDHPKKTKVKVPYDFDAEMKSAYLKPMKYDNNRSAKDVVNDAAREGKINPALLMASAYQEGLGKAILTPDKVSQSYIDAKKLDKQNFPVDGFYNYGTDTFGNNYAKLKKYLPEGFESRFQLYDAINEDGAPVKTAAFRTNKDGLIAKAAFLNMEADNITSYAKMKGVDLDDKTKTYLTLAAYNRGPGAARHMLKEYMNAKDKDAFIEKGQTSLKGVHANIMPRMKRMLLASELLK